MDEDFRTELTSKEERYRKKVQSMIEYCFYCQPYDEGEAVWIFGDRTELDYLFDTCNVPEEYWNNIKEHLFCPFCGHSDFSYDEEVGVKTKFEEDVEKHMNEAYHLHGKEVREFENLIESFPLLAYQNKFAKRIYKEIKEKKLPITSVNGKFYRARKVENSEVISSKKMYNPPLGKPEEGRFNHAGQSHLYLSNNKETSIKEVVSDEHSLLVWCQEFEITEKINDILDLSFDWSLLTPSTSTLLLSLKVHDSISRSDRNRLNWKPDYYLTRYIMDCAKSNGFNGIKYNSVKDSYNFDVVLFFPDKIQIETIGNPCVEIFLNKEEKEKFTSDLFDL